MSHPGPLASWRWLLVACYIVTVVLMVWGLATARQWALAGLSTPESVSDWQAWREDVQRQQDQPAPVQRRVPNTAEPPTLVLMRDHFAVMLCGAIVLSTALYWIAAWLVVGALAPPTTASRD